MQRGKGRYYILIMARHSQNWSDKKPAKTECRKARQNYIRKSNGPPKQRAEKRAKITCAKAMSNCGWCDQKLFRNKCIHAWYAYMHPPSKLACLSFFCYYELCHYNTYRANTRILVFVGNKYCSMHYSFFLLSLSERQLDRWKRIGRFKFSNYTSSTSSFMIWWSSCL